ncbi:HutD family protein [Microbacterium sp. LTA6]|uniref:HutD family protein n=1 Tax=Microbacterium sp. LTA6 TaxID=3129771 RepID=UPI0032488A6E
MSTTAWRVIHPSGVASTRWANGLGTTRELASGGDGAWRLSLADIGAEAEFSSLPGIDRLLIALSGGVVLRVAGVESEFGPGDYVEFPGEASVSGWALASEASVINLMVARDAVRYEFCMEGSAREIALPALSDEFVVLLGDGQTAAGERLERGTVLLPGAASPDAASVVFTEGIPICRVRLSASAGSVQR